MFLDAELAGLMDEPDWKEVNRRLDDAAKKWCANRQEGAGNPLNEDELVQVLLILIRNVRGSYLSQTLCRPLSQDRLC